MQQNSSLLITRQLSNKETWPNGGKTMNRQICFFLLLLATLAFAEPVLAQPKVTLETTLEKEVLTMEDEKFVTKFVEAGEASPGDTIRVTLTLSNTGDEKAINLVIDNPVPEGAQYIQGTASEDLVTPLFSVDDGKTFKNVSLLTFDITLPDGTRETRKASPENYTTIRWTIPEIAAGGTRTVSFKALIK
jgi:uncharacterized repeat protein (TIGR01451 family)